MYGLGLRALDPRAADKADLQLVSEPGSQEGMYQSYWGLRDAPFRNTLDSRRFVRSEAYEEALARMHFLVEGHWRLALLLGPAGIGKSLLLQQFAGELRQQHVQVGRVDLRGRETDEVLWQIASGLGLNPSESASHAHLWRLLADRLAENRLQQLGTVLLLDNVDRAPREVHEQIVRLLQIDGSADARVSVIASAQSIGISDLATLLPLVELRIELEPWTLEESQQYIAQSLVREGCQRKIFSYEALVRLHEISAGNPRKLNHLAELALIAGAGSELPQIDTHTIEAVEYELGMPAIAHSSG